MIPARLLALLVSVILASSALAQDSWVGKRVILKKPGIRIGFTDESGKQVYVAELTALAYPVLKESDGFIKVNHRGEVGWFTKSDALLPDEAIVYFTERARTAKPSESFPHAYLGWAYKEKQQYEQALSAYDDAIKREPRADWFNNRGLIYMEMKQPEKAVADFTEAIKKAPKFVVALENRAMAYTKADKIVLALDDWSEVIRQEPGNAQALLRRAKIYFDQHDLAKAVADLSRILKDDPANVGVLVERGQLYADMKKIDEAIADFTEVLRLKKDHIEVMLARSQLFSDRKQYASAIADAEAALAIVPSSSEALVARGWNRFLTGEFEKATADFAKAIELSPNSSAGYNSQAWMWATCPDAKFRDGKKAVEYAAKAVELSGGKEPAILDTQAAAFAESGDFDMAVATQERAIRGLSGPDAVEARARLERYQKKKTYRQTIAK